MLLRKYLTLALTANEGTISGRRQPLGYVQLLHGAMAAAVKLTLPTPQAGTTIGYLVIQCQGTAATDYVSWRDDGTAPTATVGMRLFSGQELDYSGYPYNIQFIVGSGAPDLNISLYA